MNRAALLLLVFALTSAPLGAEIASLEGLTIDLYASFEFEQQLEDEGNGDPNGSFDNDQIDLVFNYVRDRFRVALDAVFEHGTATEDGRGNVAISFGFAEYAHSNKFKLRFGKYLSPYGVHNELNSIKSRFLTVKIPLATNKPDKLAENGFRFFPRRQVGIAFLGSFPVGDASLDYDLVIGNGDQEETNPYEEDNNSQKAVTGRLVYRPSFASGLGLSVYSDKISEEGGESARLNSLALHGTWEGERVRFWLEADFGELDFDNPAATDIDQFGAFAELGYGFKNGLTTYLQVQNQETEAAGRKESATLIIPGIYYEFKKYAVVKLENAYNKGSSENGEFADLPGRDYNEIRAAVVLGF